MNILSSQLWIPKQQLTICTYGDFEPWGIEVNNWSLLKDLYHRTQIKNLKLKLFLDKNMKVTPGLH